VKAQLVVAALVLFAAPARAHERTTSYSDWRVHGARVDVTVSFGALDVSRFAWATTPARDATLASYLVERLRLTAASRPCPATETPRPLTAPTGRLAYDWRLECPSADGLEVRSDLFTDVAPTHLHFARVTVDGHRLGERVLSAYEPAAPLTARAGETSLASYLVLGLEHVVTGFDHLAFLLALLLMAGSVGEVARMVTGFTVGHSTTLALAALGWVRPDGHAVEALIGLSVVLVACENVWLAPASGRALPAAVGGALALLAGVAALGFGRVPALTLAGLALFAPCYLALLRDVARPTRLRWPLVFLFGLVHGFGFASALLEARLDLDRIVPALVGFNGGVEIAQLALVALAWPCVHALARSRPVFVDATSAALAGLGAFWFVTRAFG
jgi:hypothetical protein